MTIQTDEILVIKKQSYSILPPYPLDGYSDIHNLEWEDSYSGNWRGYSGQWEIVDNQLYLIDLHGGIKDKDLSEGEDCFFVSMHDIFPGQEKVLADWFSGILRVTSKTFSENPDFYTELHMEFIKGKLINQYILKKKKQNKPQEISRLSEKKEEGVIRF